MAPAAKSCVYAIIDAATASAGDEACELAPDCACAVTEHRAGGQTYTAAHPQHDSGQLLAAPRRLHRQKLTDDYWAVFDPDGNGGVVVLNGLALDVLERFRTPRSLQRVAAEHGGDKHFTAAVERLTALGLLRHASLVTYAAPQRSKTLSAWLHLTNQCNLRCSYCYLYKTNAAISEANGYAAVDAVIRSALQHDYHKVKLKYAGGEPMLQFPLVLALHDYAGERCAKAGLAFQATLLTNGTRFSTAAVRELQRRAINIMVSLDGVDKTGNAQRTTHGGRSSLQQVLKGIETVLATGARPHLSITITHTNCKSVPDVVRLALDHGCTFSLNLYRSNSQVSDDTALRLEPGEEQAAVIAAFYAAFQLVEQHAPRWSTLGTLLDRGHMLSPHDHSACGVGQDYMVIDHHGRVAKCQMTIDETITDVTDPDPLGSIRLSPKGVVNLATEEKEGCRTCAWQRWCAGGCPLVTFQATGRYNTQSPYCDIYRAVYPMAIHAEGMRLLRYGHSSVMQ